MCSGACSGAEVHAGTRARCGAVSRLLGQLERSPTSVITAGVRMERTRKASISSPTASTNPSCWNALDRDERERGEGGREDEPGGGDRVRGAAGGGEDGLIERAVLGLAPDAPDEEDVVVRAERDEQHTRGERDEVRDLRLAEYSLEEVGGQAEGRKGRERGDRDQVQRRHQRPQEHGEHDRDQQQHERSDAQEVAAGGVDQLAGDRRVAGEQRPRALQPDGVEQIAGARVQVAQQSHRVGAERILLARPGRSARRSPSGETTTPNG